IDLQNAPAILWRLEQMGVDIDERWRELADKAEARIGHVGHPLLVPHLMMALAATGRAQVAERFLCALREVAADTASWTAPAIASVILPVCEATLAHRQREYARIVSVLAPRREQIRLLGGSNAQRDLFMQMLVDAAMKDGRRDIVGEIIAEETQTRALPPAARAGYAAAARWLA
ncbi:MAG: hypothetical protein WCA23_06990, partial [Stellaceae bacterium]